MNLQKLLAAEHHDPFIFLGSHFDEESDRAIFRTFQPHAISVTLVVNNQHFPMENYHETGLFKICINTSQLPSFPLSPFNYQYQITYQDGEVSFINDPYSFSPQLDQFDRFLFNRGTNYKLYEHLGAHLTTIEHIEGVIFRVWAPAAKSVSVLGHFNGWDGRVHPLRSLGDSGIWELFIPGIGENERYQYQIKTQNNDLLVKSDPFQFFADVRPLQASVVKNINNFNWSDTDWQRKKNTTSTYDQPITIYELHLGSWQRDPNQHDSFLTYRQLAESLVPHIKALGFTHIELMPIMEHPLDESWGYQVTGPFSVTSRYGTPEDFQFFVNQCHLNDIGVILDWVPAHFPKDDHSLARFDGTALFEHEDPRKGAHPEWGTFIYNYSRFEVSNFLIANALFWLDKYHIDGLRVDAVASMLYLDYSRKEGEWIPNCYGGKENLEAIEFLKHLNSVVYDLFPNTMMIAEESTSFYGVSKPADSGGLGFGYKWNMGWMNDILDYFAKDPLYRKFHHNALTFPLMYAFSENFILPLSHDEVVHGKKSLLNKMPGDEWQKFANLRLLYAFMWCHPGKKLLFMGGEFGQYSEWFCKTSLDWHLVKENSYHQKLQYFIKELNQLYLNNPALWQIDFDHSGFQWLDLEDKNNSIISFARFAKEKDDHLVGVFNFTPQTFDNYTIALPKNKKYSVIFCSDALSFGGSGKRQADQITPTSQPYALGEFQADITIPPLACIILKPS